MFRRSVMEKETNKTCTILLVEDTNDDVFLFRRMLARLDYRGDVRVVENGYHAKRYLLGEGEYRDRKYYPLPDMIVSDLKMPLMNGLEFLEWFRHQPEFNSIPVIIFSGASEGVDKTRLRALGARCYVEKPAAFEKMAEAGSQILAALKR